jgi:hypothetical protein
LKSVFNHRAPPPARRRWPSVGFLACRGRQLLLHAGKSVPRVAIVLLGHLYIVPTPFSSDFLLPLFCHRRRHRSTSHCCHHRARSGQIDRTISHVSVSRTSSTRSRHLISPGALARPRSSSSPVTECHRAASHGQPSMLHLRAYLVLSCVCGEPLMLSVLSFWSLPALLVGAA